MYTQKEINYIEEREGKIFAYEMKWGKKVKITPSKEFLATYKNSEYKVIDRDNYWDFLIS